LERRDDNDGFTQDWNPKGEEQKAKVNDRVGVQHDDGVDDGESEPKT
jgi:hypothetical protein